MQWVLEENLPSFWFFIKIFSNQTLQLFQLSYTWKNQSVRTWLCVVLNVFKWWLSRISVDGLKCDICKDQIAHRLYQREVVSIELHLEYFHRIAFTQNVFEVNWKFMEIVSNLLYLNWMTKLFEMERFWYADGILACIWLHVILKICYCIWIETFKAIFEIVKVPTCSYSLVILIKVHSMQWIGCGSYTIQFCWWKSSSMIRCNVWFWIHLLDDLL